MTHALGSEGWCTAAAEVLVGAPVGAGSARIGFDADGARWHCVVADGRVASFGCATGAELDVELRWPSDVARRIWRRELRGDDALAATSVRAPLPGGTYEGGPAPLGLAGRPELADLPVVPGATLVAQYHYRDGPFGPVGYVLDFADGRVVAERLGVADDPTVEVEVGYRTMARVRAGEITILEALEDGWVRGDPGALAMLGGISESTEFQAAERATGRHALALAVLGDLDEPLAAVAARTS